MEKLNDEKSLQVLEEMHEFAHNPPQKSEEVKFINKSPLEKVEKDIAQFTSDILDIYRKDVETSDKVNKTIQERLELDEKDGGFSNNQLIALQTNLNTTMNDKLSKTLGPIFTLMTEKQRNEYAAKQAEQKQQAAVNVNIGTNNETMRTVNESTTPEILQGMQSLNAFLNYFQKKEQN